MSISRIVAVARKWWRSRTLQRAALLASLGTLFQVLEVFLPQVKEMLPNDIYQYLWAATVFVMIWSRIQTKEPLSAK